MRTLLETRQATFSRAGEPVFEPVDLSLAGGQALVVRGTNGSGKTTLLRLLAGILRASAGTVERHAPVAFLGHLAAVKGDLSCRENLDFRRRFHATASGLSNSRALARVGLAGLGLRPARALSAGQKRRLGLACLLVAPAAIWLLDEPYASLDDDGCALVDALLIEQLGRDGSVVLSTHQRQPELKAAPNTLLVRHHVQGAG
ncbi:MULTISPECIES: heme ABC exporter ATP-binding protein CcmA [unclassified Wenzhouxiangella]|uniref:heme ABC exporter ATP-binding protein CcmA n=1 Tax=unclassified Wenzhouxiangella TaxID=2613841 RepID=UPI000E329080|nr:MULTISPECIES: heme ABC exporter ATP-binding protein CcmA [unclassified Wenzhouxiangella]RFF27531.1 heme ABC exporter ATP-binding protein CcmA [Wenzhouxiangella sp. 15181]RFP69607.1 heme ABC exporter ATP-binding protein CcmA [Wenzhouxiangella sp. 15190]